MSHPHQQQQQQLPQALPLNIAAGFPDMHSLHQQQHAQVSSNAGSGMPDMQALQRQQQQMLQQQMLLQQQAVPAGDNAMAQLLHLQQQMNHLMLMQMAGNPQQPWGSTASAPQPGMMPLQNPVGASLSNHNSAHSNLQQLESRPVRRLKKGLSQSDMENFTCPITHSVMWDPVLADDGHTYERHAIEEWLTHRPKGQSTSPMTNLPMTDTLRPNNSLARLISSREAV